MAERGLPQWPTVNFDRDPRLVVGFRAGQRRLGAHRLELHQDTFGDLRELCETALATMSTSIPRDYEPYGELERGEEYFRVDVADLPRRPPPRRPGPTDAQADGADDGTADLVQVVQRVDSLGVVAPGDLAQRYVFYGICWPLASAGFIGFVKKMDPRRALRTGGRFFQYGDVLRSVERPDLVLEPDPDLVVTDTFIAASNPNAFKDLLNDVQVALSTLPANVAAVRGLLRKTVALTDEAASALESAAHRGHLGTRVPLGCRQAGWCRDRRRRQRAHRPSVGWAQTPAILTAPQTDRREQLPGCAAAPRHVPCCTRDGSAVGNAARW